MPLRFVNVKHLFNIIVKQPVYLLQPLRYINMHGGFADPEYRRRGYGRAVCERVLAEAKRAGAREAYLAVRSSNVAAISLYRSLGFGRAYLYWYRAKEP